jgi:hypothetical protein
MYRLSDLNGSFLLSGGGLFHVQNALGHQPYILDIRMIGIIGKDRGTPDDIVFRIIDYRHNSTPKYELQVIQR